MAATIYKGTEGTLYLEDTDAQNANIPDSGISADETDDTTVKVGRIESADVKIDNELAAYYGIGSRDPTDIKEGNRAITGTLNRAVINGALLAAAMGTGTGTTPAVITATALGSYKMKIMCKTSATQYLWIILTSVKFGSWGINVANAGETVIENLEFIGIFSSAKSYGTPAAGV